MGGNNVTRKYWLIANRPNEAKKCGPFSPLVQILWGAMPPPPPAPLFLHPCSIEYHNHYFLNKFKNTKFVAHLAQRSKNVTKSFLYRWGIPANQYLKNNYPKQKSTTPPPPPPPP